MSNWLARLLLLALATPSSLALVLPAVRAPARSVAAEDMRARVLHVRMQDLPPPPQPEDEEDSLYNADFSFDATTVVALLGAAIAFNFFVLANL